jgi:hypothetical protein
MTSMTARGPGPRGGARSPPELAGANTFRLEVSALFLTILLLLCIHIVPNDQFMFLSGCDTYWIFFMSDNRTQQYPACRGGQGERPHANASLNGPCPGSATNNQVVFFHTNAGTGARVRNPQVSGASRGIPTHPRRGSVMAFHSTQSDVTVKCSEHD